MVLPLFWLGYNNRDQKFNAEQIPGDIVKVPNKEKGVKENIIKVYYKKLYTILNNLLVYHRTRMLIIFPDTL